MERNHGLGIVKISGILEGGVAGRRSGSNQGLQVGKHSLGQVIGQFIGHRGWAKKNIAGVEHLDIGGRAVNALGKAAGADDAGEAFEQQLGGSRGRVYGQHAQPVALAGQPLGQFTGRSRFG